LLVADTTFLVDLSTADDGAVRTVDEADETGEIIATTFINVHEFLLGNARRKGEARERGQRLLGRLLVLPGDQRSAALSSQAAVELLERGAPVATVDLLIAGIVMRDGGILLTRDRDFSRIPGLATKSY
jgi:tRNA(fMet)-specific endonuclease VapC